MNLASEFDIVSNYLFFSILFLYSSTITFIFRSNFEESFLFINTFIFIFIWKWVVFLNKIWIKIYRFFDEIGQIYYIYKQAC